MFEEEVEGRVGDRDGGAAGGGAALDEEASADMLGGRWKGLRALIEL